MLLTIDIGNTSVSFGLFRGKRLVQHWRRESREPWQFPKALRIDGAVIASVVPEADAGVKKSIKRTFGLKPVFVTHKNAGVKIGYPRPWEIGADRLAVAVAAWRRYRAPCIVVDMGTATTLDYVDGSGTYLGGVIFPGLGISNEALYQAAAKLPKVGLARAFKMIPSSTAGAIQCGVYQGYIGMVERLIQKTVEEIGGNPKIVATGGYAKLIAKDLPVIKEVRPLLVLEGLQAIWSGRLLKPCS